MKFTIRELLLVTVIAAVCVAWWLDRRRLSQTIESQNAQLETLKAKEAAARGLAEATAAVEVAEAALKRALDNLSNSSASTLKLPKKQAGPHNRP